MFGPTNGKRNARPNELLNAFHGDFELATQVVMTAKNELNEMLKELRELTASTLKFNSFTPITLQQAVEVHAHVVRMGEIARLLQASDLLAALCDIEREMNRAEIRLDMDFAQVQGEVTSLTAKMNSFLKLTSL